MATAARLRCCLETGTDGATFHPSLQALPIPAMGGGMGVVATARIPPGTTLARIPFSSMITVKKARLNLALAEVALESGGGDGQTVFASDVVPFVASPWPHDGDERRSAAAVSPPTRAAVKEKVAFLQRRLSGTDTVVCYLILMAALYGRWGVHAEDAAGPRALIRFTHENSWMGTWIRCLPSMYDNLLELGIRGGRADFDGDGSSPGRGADTVNASSPLQSARSHARAIDAVLAFPRHQLKVRVEHAEVWQRYEHCLSLLRCLQQLPRGELVEERGLEEREAAPLPAPSCPSTSSVGNAAGGGGSCSLEQYLWAFNSLVSRGFAFDEDVWAMIPYVDYFNYALEANGTMYCQRTTAGAGEGTRGHRIGKGGLTMWKRGGGRGDESGLSFSSQYEYLFQTTRPVEAGEQVFLHYGAYSDFELLMWYGFAVSPFLLPQDLHTNEGGDGDSAVEGRAARSQLLRQLQDDDTRKEVFRRLQRSVPANAPEREQAEEAERDATAYDMWQTALQRAYSHVFTPLADTDGDYPVPAEGTSWLGELIADFLKCKGKQLGRSEESAVHAWSLHLARSWRDNAASREKLMHLKGLTSSAASRGPAALGVLGPSLLMADTIRFLGSHGARGAFLGEEVGDGEERAAALRALAWMELVTAAAPPPAVSQGEEERDLAVEASCQWVQSAPAASMAERVSRDVEALLRFLALEATEMELCCYLAHEPEY